MRCKTHPFSVFACIEDWDLTTKKLYSLSDATKERLDNLDKDIVIQIINLSDYENHMSLDTVY